MTKSKPDRIRLLIVDDHKVVRLGLMTMFGRHRGVQIVADVGTMAEAIEGARRLKPDVVLMDVRLPDGSGIEACRDIRTTCPDTQVLILDLVCRRGHPALHGGGRRSRIFTEASR